MDLGPHPDAARASTPSSSSNVASDPQHLQAHAAAGAAASAPSSSPATAHEARPPCRRGRGRHRSLARAPRRRLPVRPGTGSGSSSVGLHRRAADHGEGLPGRVNRRRAGGPHHGGPFRRRGPGGRGPFPVARHGRRVPAQGVREGGAGLRAARRRGLLPGHPRGDRPAGGRDGRRARAVRRHDERGGGGVDRGAGPEPAAAEAEAGGAGRAAGDPGGAGGRGAQRHRVRDRHQGLPRAGRVGAGGGPRRRRHGRRRQDGRRGHRQGQHRLGLLQGGQADRGQESGDRRARVQPAIHQDPGHQLWSP